MTKAKLQPRAKGSGTRTSSRLYEPLDSNPASRILEVTESRPETSKFYPGRKVDYFIWPPLHPGPAAREPFPLPWQHHAAYVTIPS